MNLEPIYQLITNYDSLWGFTLKTGFPVHFHVLVEYMLFVLSEAVNIKNNVSEHNLHLETVPQNNFLLLLYFFYILKQTKVHQEQNMFRVNSHWNDRESKSHDWTQPVTWASCAHCKLETCLKKNLKIKIEINNDAGEGQTNSDWMLEESNPLQINSTSSYFHVKCLIVHLW